MHAASASRRRAGSLSCTQRAAGKAHTRENDPPFTGYEPGTQERRVEGGREHKALRRRRLRICGQTFEIRSRAVPVSSRSFDYLGRYDILVRLLSCRSTDTSRCKSHQAGIANVIVLGRDVDVQISETPHTKEKLNGAHAYPFHFKENEFCLSHGVHTP
jgi:hypothetical protein